MARKISGTGGRNTVPNWNFRQVWRSFWAVQSFWPREILGRIAAVMPHRAAAVYPRQTRPTLILRSVNAALLEGTLPSYHKARRDSSAILRCEVTSTSGVGGGGRAPVPELTPASPKIFFKAEPPKSKTYLRPCAPNHEFLYLHHRESFA